MIYTKKNMKDENGATVGKKIFWDCKLKLRTFLWGHGEHEWPLGATVYQPEIF